ncbi:unnamed protein product, partial [Ixodes pacificus]
NVATHRPAFQSSSRNGGKARLAVDGKRRTCSVTRRETSPWFIVDLERVVPVSVVKLDFPRIVLSRLSLSVRVGNLSVDFGKHPMCNGFRGTPSTARSVYLPCMAVPRGRYVSLHFSGVKSLSICELEVYSE